MWRSKAMWLLMLVAMATPAILALAVERCGACSPRDLAAMAFGLAEPAGAPGERASGGCRPSPQRTCR